MLRFYVCNYLLYPESVTDAPGGWTFIIEILRQLRDDWQFVFLRQLTQSTLATKTGWNIIVAIKRFHFWLLNFRTWRLMMKLRSIKLQKHPFHRWHTLTLTKTGAFHVHLFFFGSLQCFAKQYCICKYRRIFSMLQTMSDTDVLAFLMVSMMESSKQIFHTWAT